MSAPQAKQETSAGVYQAPRLYVIGPVTKFTFGSGGNGLDNHATHTKHSDARLKRDVEPIRDPLGKLRAL